MSPIFKQEVVKKSELIMHNLPEGPCIMRYALCMKFIGNMGGFHPKAMHYKNYALRQNAL